MSSRGHGPASEARPSGQWFRSGFADVMWPTVGNKIPKGGEMQDPLSKAENYRKLAVKYRELAEFAQPTFLGDFYRGIAVRYAFMAQEVSERANRDGFAPDHLIRGGPDVAIDVRRQAACCTAPKLLLGRIEARKNELCPAHSASRFSRRAMGTSDHDDLGRSATQQGPTMTN
jgi:hypothetical protein